MASAGVRAYNAGLRTKPPASSMGTDPGQRVRGQNPLKLIDWDQTSKIRCKITSFSVLRVKIVRIISIQFLQTCGR